MVNGVIILLFIKYFNIYKLKEDIVELMKNLLQFVKRNFIYNNIL